MKLSEINNILRPSPSDELMTLCGIPISQLSKEQLMACVRFCYQMCLDAGEQRRKALDFPNDIGGRP